jgi:hypothetical protein
MTSITRDDPPDIRQGLRLIAPAYQSAFEALEKAWVPLAFGAVVTIATVFIGRQGIKQADALNGPSIWSALAYFAIIFMIYLVISAKVWTICFNAQNPTLAAPTSVFGKQERAAFGALFEVSIATALISILPLIILATLGWWMYFVLSTGTKPNGTVVNFLFYIALVAIGQTIVARYLMAIPIAVSDKSTNNFKSNLLGQAWRHTQDWYPTILKALIPIWLIGEGAITVIKSAVALADQTPWSLAAQLSGAIVCYGFYVISALASMHVILHVWSQTRETAFD